MSIDQKLSNPKEGIGATKLPLHLVPSTATAYESLAFLEGALKYGKYNWRVVGVRLSTYLDALERHYSKFKDGEWADPVTKVPHLASMRACLAVIIDAHVCGKLTDDRPPAAPVSQMIDSLAVEVEHLKQLFKDHHPHQHTIMDEVNVETFRPMRAEWAGEMGKPNADTIEYVRLPQRPTSEECDRKFHERVRAMNDDWTKEEADVQ